MNLMVLGCAPVLQRNTCFNCSGYLVDRRILIDIGPGIWKALCEQKIGTEDLQLLLLSHFHIDHTSDLAPMLMAWFLTHKPDGKKLRIAGPPGLAEWLDRFYGLLGSWSRQLPLELIELPSSCKIDDYALKTAPTGHTGNSICIRITDKSGKSLFYSGDSDYNDSLVKTAAGSDLALIESSNLEDTKSEGHMTPQQAGEIASEANVKHLLLTHLYPEVRETDPIPLAALKYRGKISVAYDGWAMEI